MRLIHQFDDILSFFDLACIKTKKQWSNNGPSPYQILFRGHPYISWRQIWQFSTPCWQFGETPPADSQLTFWTDPPCGLFALYLFWKSNCSQNNSKPHLRIIVAAMSWGQNNSKPHLRIIVDTIVAAMSWGTFVARIIQNPTSGLLWPHLLCDVDNHSQKRKKKKATIEHHAARTSCC